MISLPSIPSNQPLESPSDLVEHLSASPRPAVIHYTDGDRTELSGRVAVNWATKMTHLLDSYGIAAPATVFIDLPVTWRSAVLLLGVAWTQLDWVSDPDEADAIVTDRPDEYLTATAEIFVTHQDDVDPALVNVDDEVLSHPDQALLPAADIIGRAQVENTDDELIQALGSGTVIAAADIRFDANVWWAMVDAWRRSHPVVLIESADEAQLARIIQTEQLDSSRGA